MNWLRCANTSALLKSSRTGWIRQQLYSSIVSNTEQSVCKDVAINRSVSHTRAEMYEKLLYLQPDTPPDGRMLKVSVLGFPNSGKSSLVNMLAGWRVCATTSKVNTTRSKQSVVFTKDNVQLVFLDLPGVVSRSKVKQHRLDKTLIRDPHAGIFESDLIMVVVDVTHKHKRDVMDQEILKALHFFKEKPSILVLNKVDRITKARTRLLDYTRKLTGGVVAGRINHSDKYSYRYSRDTPSVEELLAGPKAMALLAKHDKSAHLLSESQEYERDKSVHLLSQVEDSRNALSLTDNVDVGQEEQDSPPSNIINEITASSDDLTLQRVEAEELTQNSVVQESTSAGETFEDHMDPILMLLKNQLMLNSATREEVHLRKQKWRQIGDQVAKETNWTHFDEVFMVSAATGSGIDNLRDYLLFQSKPGLWSFHSSLVTDEDPHEMVKMCVWAHFLEVLKEEVPYQLKLTVDDYDKGADGTIFIKVTTHCRTERHLMHVIGIKGMVIKKIAEAAKQELMNTFQTNVVLKLAAVRRTIPKSQLEAIRKSGDFRKVFPDMKLNM